MITRGISSHVRYLLEEKDVRLLSLSLLSSTRPLLKHPWTGLFFSTSVANETGNLNIWKMAKFLYFNPKIAEKGCS